MRRNNHLHVPSSPAEGEAAAQVSNHDAGEMGKTLPPIWEDAEFWHSVRMYAMCIACMAPLWLLVLSQAPDVPANEPKCQDVTLFAGSDPEKISRLIECARIYQAKNRWFVFGLFELTYVVIKSLAIPAAFTLCLTGGAIFQPFALYMLLGAFGEACGSSLCYLMSSAFARPLLERLAPVKLGELRARRQAEQEHMLLFCFFLRLTPFVPNFFVNMASPIVRIPLRNLNLCLTLARTCHQDFSVRPTRAARVTRRQASSSRRRSSARCPFSSSRAASATRSPRSASRVTSSFATRPSGARPSR